MRSRSLGSRTASATKRRAQPAGFSTSEGDCSIQYPRRVATRSPRSGSLNNFGYVSPLQLGAGSNFQSWLGVADPISYFPGCRGSRIHGSTVIICAGRDSPVHARGYQGRVFTGIVRTLRFRPCLFRRKMGGSEAAVDKPRLRPKSSAASLQPRWKIRFAHCTSSHTRSLLQRSAKTKQIEAKRRRAKRDRLLFPATSK